MRLLKLSCLGVLLVLAGVACNPSDFDTALDKAPVVSYDDGSSAGAPFVLPLPSPPAGGSVAAQMLVTRKNNPYLALATYDKSGKLGVHQASDSDLAVLGNVAVNDAAMLGPGDPILLGTPRYGAVGGLPPTGAVDLLTLTTAASGATTFTITPVTPAVDQSDHYGIAVAAGQVMDLTSHGQFVVASDFAVYLVATDGSRIAATDCVGSLADPAQGPYGFRPIAVADLFAGGGQEIALGGPGRVVFVQYDAASKTLQCLANATLSQTSTAFGSSLAVADFDLDGAMDLAVGAPPFVYVYFGPLDTPGEVATIGSAGSTSFGKRLAVFPMPVGTGPRLMVSDPTATANGRSGAGKVQMLRISRGLGSVDAASLTTSTLFDSASDSPTGVFGDVLGSLQLDATACGGGVMPLPWAASGGSILAYFNYPGATGDPRCWGK